MGLQRRVGVCLTPIQRHVAHPGLEDGLDGRGQAGGDKKGSFEGIKDSRGLERPGLRQGVTPSASDVVPERPGAARNICCPATLFSSPPQPTMTTTRENAPNPIRKHRILTSSSRVLRYVSLLSFLLPRQTMAANRSNTREPVKENRKQVSLLPVSFGSLPEKPTPWTAASTPPVRLIPRCFPGGHTHGLALRSRNQHPRTGPVRAGVSPTHRELRAAQARDQIQARRAAALSVAVALPLRPGRSGVTQPPV